MKTILIVIVIILFAGGIIWLVAFQKNILSQANLTQALAVVEFDKTVQDLGNMKVSEERTAEFEIRNAGSQPLVMSGLQTSCMCTFGQIIIGENKSPIFGMAMHGNPKWQGSLEPGQTAVAKVIYRPYLMPVQGPVERIFTFETNDPLNQKVNLVIKAFVE
ncbi:MAG: DUF1573 domain-containing protein [Candidatus Nealsonbacteria bacterium]|nr:DUF1573 domain-containing protein [Candidatus Nealsonbacteria bacterium]